MEKLFLKIWKYIGCPFGFHIWIYGGVEEIWRICSACLKKERIEEK